MFSSMFAFRINHVWRSVYILCEAPFAYYMNAMSCDHVADMVDNFLIVQIPTKSSVRAFVAVANCHL
jgi:hypothetical protein